MVSLLTHICVIRPQSMSPVPCMRYLVQVMVCRLVGTKPLPEPILIYCQLHQRAHTWMKFRSQLECFYSRKCNLKCCLQNGGHFIWLPLCQKGNPNLVSRPHSPTQQHTNASLIISGCVSTLHYQSYVSPIRHKPETDGIDSVNTSSFLYQISPVVVWLVEAITANSEREKKHLMSLGIAVLRLFDCYSSHLQHWKSQLSTIFNNSSNISNVWPIWTHCMLSVFK